MKVKGNPLVVILIMVLVDFASSLRANHDIPLTKNCSDLYAESKPLKSFDQYLEAKIPGRGEWYSLDILKLPNQVTPGDFAHCFLLERNRLYLIDNKGNKAGYILPFHLVAQRGWQWALVGDDAFINANSQQYFGYIYTEPCTVPGTVKIVCVQFSKGIIHISYLVSNRSPGPRDSSSYIDTRFIGAGMRQKGKFPDENYCFKF